VQFINYGITGNCWLIAVNWSEAMTDTGVLIIDMAILVGIFLLGLLAKIFPKRGRNIGSKQ